MENLEIKKYPYDKTAAAVTNLVVAEPHEVGVQLNRMVAPNAGPYYSDTMVVVNPATGKELVRGTDWKPQIPYIEASDTTERPVSNLVLILNPDITSVNITYQVPGGPFSTYIDAIVKLINQLQQDDRDVAWDNIIGKPVSFNPKPHLHYAPTDLYGLEYEILALEEILRAIQMGDVASHDVLYQYIENLRQWVKDELAKRDDQIADIYVQIERLDKRIDQVIADLQKLRDDLTAHIQDKNNPHATTKGQVGLGLVNNYATATNNDMTVGTATNLYVTPANVAFAISSQWTNIGKPYVDAHINNKSNPHAVTAAQVGLGSVANYRMANDAEATGGSAVLYASPRTIQLYVASWWSATSKPYIDAHINDKNNPHATTAAQVGLGSVANLPRASQAEARALSTNERYCTPWSVNQGIDAFYSARLINTDSWSGKANGIVSIGGDGLTRVGYGINFLNSNGSGVGAQFYWNGSQIYTPQNLNVNDVYVRSDERVKRKIRYMQEEGETVSETLRNLVPYVSRYELANEIGVEQIGIIAQGFEKHAPEIVAKNPETGILSLKPAGEIALLLKGWDEHDKRLSAIEENLGRVMEHLGIAA